MKKCPQCSAHFITINPSCPQCGFQPERKDRFTIYAPDMASNGGGFKDVYFSDLANIEAGNFWFRARNRLIIWAVGKYMPTARTLLEVGCGTGFVLNGISAAYPQIKLLGAELFTAGLAFAASRLPSIEFIQMDARNIPFASEFDVVGAFDVLEHIEEDRLVLDQMHEALMPSGIMLLTVPQHAWLWSSSDDYACHVRRYSAKDIHEKVERAGFKIVLSTSFVATLLPAMLISRLLNKRALDEFDALAEFRISPWLNRLLEIIMNAEILLIRCGIRLPWGGSRLIVAKKI